MPILPTPQQAEERAVAIADQLGYEIREWHGRWHWRKTSWRPGVWHAGEYRSRLQALEGIIAQMGK